MKRKLKLYVCGKVTGDPNYKNKFRRAEYRLRRCGYDAANPAEEVPAGTEWNTAMKTALKLMLDCDGVATLPDCDDSRGAAIEIDLAREVGINVASIEKWIEESKKGRAKVCLECRNIEDCVIGFCNGRYSFSNYVDGITDCSGFEWRRK